MATSKRQQTMAKMARERAVKEKRLRKQEKKQAAKAERKALASGEHPPVEDFDGEPSSLEHAEGDLPPVEVEA